jgi:hypothetical protein
MGKYHVRLTMDTDSLCMACRREVIKLGLIYVAPGQDSERAILSNNSGSLLYNQFVASLGWQIDLRTHAGYRGRLDTTENYHTATYYADSTVELIFHDATRMPTVEGDPQQVNKVCHMHGCKWMCSPSLSFSCRNVILVTIMFTLCGTNIGVITDLAPLEVALVMFRLSSHRYPTVSLPLMCIVINVSSL